MIGGGGKTTLLQVLGRELSRLGTVIVATSTKLYPMPQMTNLTAGTMQDLRAALAAQHIVCVGSVAGSGKLSAPHVAFSRLAELADFVLVEADGSNGLPVKAHLPFEPVIPPETNQVICVVGMSALGQQICRCAHRPQLYAALAHCSTDTILTPEIAAGVLRRERLHHRVLLNQTHSVEEYQLAYQLAALLDCPVAAGSLQKEIYVCLS